MEWVVTIGKTIEEAKELALDQLGVAEDDAEFEVLDEPKVGLFGRVRGEAKVRARVRPTTPRPKVDRRDRRRRAESTTESTTPTVAAESSTGGGERRSRNGSRRAPGASGAPSGARAARTPKPSAENAAEQSASPRRGAATTKGHDDVSATEVGAQAQVFLDGLMTAFGVSATTAVDVAGDEIDVRVEGADLGLLVGPRGTTLQAVQDLTRVVAQRRLGDHETRLRVDIGGYRQRRSAALAEFSMKIAAQVIADGAARRLEPMSSSDRKVVHDTLSTVDGVVTSSSGEEPNRCVVVSPATGDQTPEA